MTDLIVDSHRLSLWHENDQQGTGIYVRARLEDRWGSYDIVTLDRDSLIRWLKCRGGDNQWAENVVLALLGHEQV